jgi:hypothetical glycosyl hydrolase
MLIETADFWCSRASLNEATNRLEILDIIGPDEYTEHVDNNAYTNYMAYENVKLAYNAISDLKNKPSRVYNSLLERYDLDSKLSEWKNFLERIYLPKPNSAGIIPQDDTFLNKKEIEEIELYRNSDTKQAILLDYSRKEVVDMQILKQADLVMLLNLKPHLFPPGIVERNVRFYESRTVHDSSLSYCAHAIACANIGEMEMADEFFHKAMEIDLNTNYNDSMDGIHAAALGGIWNCVILGFAGVRYHHDYVELSPHMPDGWEKMSFYLKIHGQYILITIRKDKIILTAETSLQKALSFMINGELCSLEETLEIDR